MPKIDRDTAIRTIWGAILPHLIPLIRGETARLSERYIPDRLKNILASLIGAEAQIFEKTGGLWYEIGSDILEQISGGIKAPVEERERARPEERRMRITWPSLEELRAIKEKAQSPSLKRDFLKKFSSKNVWENIDKLSDEETDQFLDVLISLSELQREIEEEYKIKIDLNILWQGLKEGLEKFYEISKEKLSETKKAVKKLDQEASEKAESIKELRGKIRKHGLFPR